MVQTHQDPNINIEELAKTLEPLIRRVVREELERIAKKVPDVFFLNPDMPIYEDMKEILERKAQDQLKFHSHKEVWVE